MGGVTIIQWYLKNIQSYNLSFWEPYAYNNIFVIISAVAFFMFIMSFKFKSNFVNWIATSCLAVYLIQDGGIFKYVWLNQYANASNPIINILFWLSISLVFFICAILFDKIRIIILQPVWVFFYKFEPKIEKVFSTILFKLNRLRWRGG